MKLSATVALFVGAILMFGCSSKKYDSWSDCINGEWARTHHGVATRNYCDSHYDMTERERQVAHDNYCAANGYPQGCVGPGGVATEAAADLSAESTSAKAGPPEGPKIGDVVDGYRFIGGDPANRNSWVRED